MVLEAVFLRLSLTTVEKSTGERKGRAIFEVSRREAGINRRRAIGYWFIVYVPRGSA